MILSEVHVGAAAGDTGSLSPCEDHFVTRVRYLDPSPTTRDRSVAAAAEAGAGMGAGVMVDHPLAAPQAPRSEGRATRTSPSVGCTMGDASDSGSSLPVRRDSDGDLLLRRPRRAWRDLVVHHTLSTDLRGVGQQLWRGAFLLADHLLQHPHAVAGRHVVELGAGVGLLSLVAAIAGAAHVFCTDHDQGALRLATRTVADSAATAAGRAPVEVRALDWFAPLPLPTPPSLGEAGVPCPSSGPADAFAWVASDGPAWAATRVILCADCVYDTAATRALFRTMEAIMRAAGGAGSGAVALCALVRASLLLLRCRVGHPRQV